VLLRLARPLRYRAQSTSQEIVRVQLAGAKLDPVALADDQPAPLVRNVRAEQGEKDAAIYFQVDPSISGLQDHAEDDGRTILLTLLRGQAPPEPRSAYVQPLIEVRDSGGATDSFDLVVLDPGHGGFDRGVQAAGRLEKDVVLRLAQQVQPLLERELGVRVLLTRNSDETITPEARAEIANRLRADAFISLHCNGWYDASAHGFEVLYPVAERSPAADAAHASASRGLADFSPWDAGQMPFVARSTDLADLLQAELGRQLEMTNRGTRAAAIEVLAGATMPAVLLEVGFLTDPDEAAKIDGGEFPARLAAGLAAALRQLQGQAANPDSTATPPAVRRD
jgi:N-acetylmuramoyl-L-alanine amidase